MSRQNENRGNIGTGVGITLLGVSLTVAGYFLPGVWHDVPAVVSYLGILVGVVVIVWGLWLVVAEKIDWSK